MRMAWLLICCGVIALAHGAASATLPEGRAGETNQTSPPPNEPYVSPVEMLGSWIWTDTTHNGQTCQFWRRFEIPSGVKVLKARLLMSADDEFTLYLDGQPLGRGADWRELFDFDFLAPMLRPGSHVLAIRAFNAFHSAGLVFGLRIDLSDGRHIEIRSDDQWSVVPNTRKNFHKVTELSPEWSKAVVRAPVGSSPWQPFPANIDKMPALQPVTIHFWQRGWFQITLSTVCAVVIVISLRLMTQLALHRKERRLLQRERARIARDIHDDIGARMSQLVLHGEVAQSELPEDSGARAQLDRMCQDARGILTTMDEILWAVNPQRDTFRDFVTFVCNYAEDFFRHTSIQCRFEVDPEMPPVVLDLPLRRSLLMAIKETLNNAAKHSQATELRLQIHCRDQRLSVVVLDNGRGFDPAAAKSDRHGLTNITERMREVGGSCTLFSEPGKGTRVEFVVPLKHSPASRRDLSENN